MKLIEDDNRFDDHQRKFLEYLIQSIRTTLEEGGAAEAEVATYTENLAFSIAAAIDSSLIMEHEGKPLVPVLTFAVGEEGKEDLLTAAAGSWMHEYAMGMVHDLLEEENPWLVAEDETALEEEAAKEAEASAAKGLSRCFIKLQFTSGVVARLYHDLGLDADELVESLGDEFYMLTTGANCDDDLENLQTKVSAHGSAFAEMEGIEFSKGDETADFTLKEPGLADLTIAALADRIIEWMKYG